MSEDIAKFVADKNLGKAAVLGVSNKSLEYPNSILNSTQSIAFNGRTCNDVFCSEVSSSC